MDRLRLGRRLSSWENFPQTPAVLGEERLELFLVACLRAVIVIEFSNPSTPWIVPGLDRF